MKIEDVLCRWGILPTSTWQTALKQSPLFLYAGDLRPHVQQYRTHIGLTPFRLSRRTINHDATQRLPIPDGSVDRYQAEDVFEHIEYGKLPEMFEDIYRVLKPGGLFRLSVPDYGFDVYQKRTQLDADGNFLFDPVGGGKLSDGKVVGGGHVWFPTAENVLALFNNSSFGKFGSVHLLHGYLPQGPVLEPIDYSLGNIMRTPDHDPRGQNPRRPISVVVDAYKKNETV